MKSKILSCFLVSVIVLSCSSGKKGFNNVVIISPNDGKSFETAVIINEKSESAGIHAEYQWIRDQGGGHYCNQS